MTATRRGFITGLVALAAAPAIVRAGSLMRLPAARVLRPNTLMTIDMITRDAVRRFRDCNELMLQVEAQYRADYDLIWGTEWPASVPALPGVRRSDFAAISGGYK